jgi:hypothetical protein
MKMSELESGEGMEQSGQAISPDSQEIAAEQFDSAPDYSEMDEGQLVEMLQARDKELSTTKESYTNLRSVHDKHYTEQAQEMGRLKGMMEAMQNNAQKPQGITADDQAAFDQEWADKIADDPGKNTIEFLRSMINELRDERNEQLNGVQSTVNEKFLSLDPTFKENRELVEQISQEFGVDKVAAVKIAAKFAPKTTKQPGAVSAPGRVDNNSSAAATSQKQRVSQLGASPIGDSVATGVLSMLGLTEKEAKEILYQEAS